MRYLLLTGLLAGVASASIITSDPNLDLTIDGTNLQYANIVAGIGDRPYIGIYLGGGYGAVGVSAVLTTYATILGADGAGTIIIDENYQDCPSFPFFAGGCRQQLEMVPTFTFGVPVRVVMRLRAFLDDVPAGSVSGGMSGPSILAVIDSIGNRVDATITFSATANSVAEVSNPEPATWLLFGAGLAALAVCRSRYVSALRLARMPTIAGRQ